MSDGAQGKVVWGPRRVEAHKWSGMTSPFALLAGVILPALALFVELSTHMFRGPFFDPVPTPAHALWIFSVPLANGLAAWSLSRGRGRRLACVLNGVALSAAGFYTVVFLPVLPFALILLLGGIGLLGLAPIASLWATVRAHFALRSSGVMSPAGCTRAMLAGLTLGFLLPVALNLRALATDYWVHQVSSASLEDQVSGLESLREWGDVERVVELSYGVRARDVPDPVSYVLGTSRWRDVTPQVARSVLFRMTGESFDERSRPTINHWWNSAWTTEDEGEARDRGQGGARVAGRLRSLSLASSRLDARVASDESHAYWEWTLRFANSDTWQSREARTMISLPPGGVVSRLTLWVDGEEREAAFDARGKVREAYQNIVRQRRDPVLVTSAGTDRVLVQCFPVLPQGEMKIRVGITAPLIVRDDGEALVLPPRLGDRNFVTTDAESSVWIESDRSIRDGPLAEAGDANQAFGALPIDALLGADASWTVGRAADECWAPVGHGGDGFIAQRVVRRAPTNEPSLVMLIDGAKSTAQHADDIADFVTRVPADVDLQVAVTTDFGVVWLPPTGRETLAKSVRDHKFVGGHDATPGLLAAVGSAVERNAPVLWMHGKQPDGLSSADGLTQVLERSEGDARVQCLDVAGLGGHAVLDEIAKTKYVEIAPRFTTLDADLDALFERTWGEGHWGIARTRVDGIEPDTPLASPHVARLWAHDEVEALAQEGDAASIDAAIALAVQSQLVTTVSGAVVLETAEQYERAGLEPVPPRSVPSIPEPETWALIAAALVALVVVRRLA